MATEDRQRLYRTMAGVLGVASDTIDDTSAPETIASWDSLTHLQLVLALESEFAVTFTAGEMLELRSVRAIVDWFRARSTRP